MAVRYFTVNTAIVYNWQNDFILLTGWLQKYYFFEGVAAKMAAGKTEHHVS